MRGAASAAGRVDAELTGVLQGAEDRVLTPRASARLRGCTVTCEAEVTGVADLLRLERRLAERVPQFAAARLFAPGPTARVARRSASCARPPASWRSTGRRR